MALAMSAQARGAPSGRCSSAPSEKPSWRAGMRIGSMGIERGQSTTGGTGLLGRCQTRVLGSASVRELVTSAGAEVRLSTARDWLAQKVTHRVIVIGATLEGASEVIRAAAARVRAAFGWQRMTLGRFAAT